MVIVPLSGGLGNQFYIYATGRYFAYRLNTELKLDISHFRGKTRLDSKHTHNFYELCDFNIQAKAATPEEVRIVKEKGLTISKEPVWDTLKDFKGDILVTGAIVDHKNIINIVDILRKEFTLKKPFSPNAEAYRQKILSAECSVSMHFRHGDYAYWPNLTQNGTRPWFNPTPLSYGYACVKVLKELFKNFTVFVFSDNLQWVKENLHLDVPTEFVEGCESATEELILMSLCQNTITPGSSFSKAAAMLNPNPNKKVLQPLYTTAEKAQEYIRALDTSHLIIRNKNFPVMASEDYINVPCDFSD